MHAACYNGHAVATITLISKGANVNAIYRSGGTGFCTPMHLAARRGHANMVLLLLSAGADRHITDERGRTPLVLAIEMIFRVEEEHIYRYERVVDLLRLVDKQQDSRTPTNSPEPLPLPHRRPRPRPKSNAKSRKSLRYM